MAGTVALSAREALVSRRPNAVISQRAAAPAPEVAEPLDQYQRADPGSVPAGSAALVGGLRARINQGGEAVRHAVEDNPLARRAAAELKAALGPLADRVGRWLDLHLKGRVTRNSSVLFGSGLRLNLPGLNLNGGTWANLYLPSVELARQAGGASRAVYVNYGADVDSPIGGLGWGRRGKANTEVNLFSVNASFDEKQQVLFLGVPGLFGVTLGRDVERGSYLTLLSAVPLTPLLFFGPLWTQSVDLYTPLLDPVIERVVKPLAGAIVRGMSAVGDLADHAWRGLKRWLAGEDAMERA